MVGKLYQKFHQQTLTFPIFPSKLEIPGSQLFSLMFVSACEEIFPFEELCFFSTQKNFIPLPPIALYTKTSTKHTTSVRLKKSIEVRGLLALFFFFFLKKHF